MSIINTVVMPHMGNEKYGVILKKAATSLKSDGYQVIEISDEQAAVFDGEEHKIVNTGK